MEADYDIVVNTDSMELIKLMTENALRKVDIIERKSDLCGDAVGKIEVIQNCLSQMRERTGRDYDIVVDLDITSPLRTVGDIET